MVFTFKLLTAWWRKMVTYTVLGYPDEFHSRKLRTRSLELFWTACTCGRPFIA